MKFAYFVFTLVDLGHVSPCECEMIRDYEQSSHHRVITQISIYACLIIYSIYVDSFRIKVNNARYAMTVSIESFLRSISLFFSIDIK